MVKALYNSSMLQLLFSSMQRTLCVNAVSTLSCLVEEGRGGGREGEAEEEGEEEQKEKEKEEEEDE